MSLSPDDRRVWTFCIRGGSPFKLEVPGNPILEYDGGLEVLKAVTTESGATQIEAVLVQHGCEVVHKGTEGQTPEQKKERSELLGTGKSEEVWPSVACLTCSFFDLHLEGYCGAEGWPSESVAQLVKIKRARRDLEACPLSYGAQFLKP